MKLSDHYNKQDYILNTALVLFFILPQSMVLYLFVPVAMLFLFDSKKRPVQSIRMVIPLLIAALFISMLLNLSSTWLTQKSVFTFVKFIILFVCFCRLKSVTIIKFFLVFTLIYLAIFQFAYQLGLPGIDGIMNTLYPLSEEEIEKYAFRETMAFSDIGGYTSRLGGIYYNSNICAFFFEALLILFVNEKRQFKHFEYIAYLLLIIICIISAGSRTSLIVLMAIALFNFSENKTSTKVSVFVVVGAFMFFYFSFGSSFRIFQVEEGMSDSFGQKASLLIHYIENQPSAFRLLFGSFTTACLPVMFGTGTFPGTDFDIGDIIVSYGFVTFILFIVFLLQSFSLLNKDYKRTLAILIWCFSNTVFMSYRASAVFMLILSIYCYKSIVERKEITQ